MQQILISVNLKGEQNEISNFSGMSTAWIWLVGFWDGLGVGLIKIQAKKKFFFFFFLNKR
jgi:hypothetical protein